jgi:ABC-type multidrug transport system ATPase subunit
MRRRVQVAQALLGDPELVLLDEPTSGLDPELVVHMRRLFAAQRGRCTLVISSHNLAELEAVCDHVIFIREGRRVSSGSLAEITGRGTVVRYLLEAAVQLGDPPAELSPLGLQWEGTVLCVTGPGDWSVSAINSQVIPWLLASGCQLLEVRQGQSLEDAYMGEHGKVSAS